MNTYLKYILIFIILSLTFKNSLAQTTENENKRMFSLSKIDSATRTYIGTPYIPFEIELLRGGKINNSNLSGKVTLLNFWFEGCVTCKEEFPTLNAIYQHYTGNSKFQLIGITFDPKENALAIVKKFRLDFPIALTKDITESQKMIFNNGFPTTIVIGPNGKIVYLRMGKISFTEGKARNNMFPLLSELLK